MTQREGMTVQELASVLERVDGDLVVEIPPQPHEPEGNLGFRVTGHSVGAGHLTLHVQGSGGSYSGRDLLRALAITSDASLLGEHECDDLFEKGIVALRRDYCDEFETVLTDTGRAAVREVLGAA